MYSSIKRVLFVNIADKESFNFARSFSLCSKKGSLEKKITGGVFTTVAIKFINLRRVKF